MSNLPLLKYRAIDANGNPISGAKLYFYKDGTTTPLSVYSDSLFTISLGTSLTADSAGYFARFFMLDSEAYKVRLTTAADVLLWEEDVVWATNLVSDFMSIRIKQIASNPIDYGALGDGVADEHEAVQDAIDAATATVDLLGKVYRCDSAISLKSNIVLQNGTLDFTNCTDNNYIVSEGTESAPTLLTVDAARGDRYVDVASVSGLAVGDWVKISSTATWSGSVKLAEIVQISSIVGLRVYFESVLSCDYAMADTASIAKLSPIKNVLLRNLEVDAAAAAPANGYVVYCDIVENFFCDNVRINDSEDCSITLKRAINTSIRNSILYSSGGSIGVSVGAASVGTKITEVVATGFSVAFDVGPQGTAIGQVIDTKIINCKTLGCSTGINVNKTSDRCFISGNIIENDNNGSDYGIYSTGIQNTIENNILIGVDSYAITDDPAPTYVANKPWRTNISGNKIDRCDRGIYLGSNLNGVVCEQNTIDNVATIGIYGEAGIQNVDLELNRISGTTITHGIKMDGVWNLRMNKNKLNGNDIALSFGALIFATPGSSFIEENDNSVDGFVTSTYVSCATTPLESLVMIGNAFLGASGAGFSSYIGGKISSVFAAGNMFKRDDDAGVNSYVVGDIAGAIVNARYFGNYFYNGTVGLTETNTGETKTIANRYLSMTVSDTAGTIVDIDAQIATLISDLAALDIRVGTAETDITDLQLFNKNRTISNWLNGVVESGTPDLRSIAYGSDGTIPCWVAVGEGGAIYKSYDGAHWSTETADAAYVGDFNCISYGGGVWVAVGTAAEIQTSTNGLAWTRRAAAGAYAGDFMCCGYNGSNLWCIAGTAGEIETAADPTGAWTQRAPDGAFADVFRGVVYGNSTWVLVGDDDEIQSSSDATTWAQRKTGGGAGEQFNSISYGENIFVVVGGGSISNEIWTAPKTDLTTWTQRTSPRISVFSGYTSVKYDSYFGWFVAVTSALLSATMNPDLITSDDGITWVKKFPPTAPLGIQSIAHDSAGFYVCVSDDALIAHSLKE